MRFIILTGLTSIILGLRYRYNILFPNFYAEDGKDLVSMLTIDGIWPSIFKPFNGYLISGNFLQAWIAIKINSLLGFKFADLPKTLAITVDIFIAAVMCWHMIALRHILNMSGQICLVFIFALISLAPWQYEILGVIGNTKFLYAYCALISGIALGENMYSNSYETWIHRLVITISILTLPTALIVGPYLAVKVIYSLRNRFSFKSICLLLLVNSTILTAAGIQMFIALSNDHSLPGYLDQPLIREKMIEIVVARPLFFGFSPALYRELNDYSSIMLLILLLILALKYRKKIAFEICYLFSSAIAITLAFTLNRTGITHDFDNYSHGSYARFFYAQNLIALAALALLIWGGKISKNTNGVLSGLIVLLSLTQFMTQSAELHPNNFMAETVGDIYHHQNEICKKPMNVKIVSLQIYPTKDWKMQVPYSVLCEK